MSFQLNILIAPLDWGLGHATRCIPIIDYLLKNNHRVSMAAPRHINDFVKQYFPNLKTIPLRGYEISYSKKSIFFSAKIIVQIPKILSAIKRERQWLAKEIEQNHYDMIISDNRYGLHHPKVQSVIMTHQVSIQTGMGKFADLVLQKLHYRFLNRFNRVWIVDEEGTNNLAGKLAHPEKLPQNAEYTGILSQMMLYHSSVNLENKTKQNNIVILLSGPEPSRSILEAEIMEQIGRLNSEDTFTIIAGNLKAKEVDSSNVNYFAKLSGQALYNVLNDADLVICRSGYSTLMDLAVLKKRALLIPTPGQTEQEYLSGYCHKRFGCITGIQGKLALKTQIEAALKTQAISINSQPNFDSLLEK